MTPEEILKITLPRERWLVQDFLPNDYMVIIAGEAGAGKSVLMYNLAYAVAGGRAFLGHPTLTARVLYFDEENALPDLKTYNEWAYYGHGAPKLEGLNDRLRIEHFGLGRAWPLNMRKAIEAHHPDLIIIDTASSSFSLKDENDNAEASRVIHTLRTLKPAGASMVVLKHEREPSEFRGRSIRGAKVWLGAFDLVLYHRIAPRAKRRKDGLRKTILEPGKVRGNLITVQCVILDPAFTSTEPKGLILQAEPFVREDE